MKFIDKATLAENVSGPVGGWVDIAIPDGETLLIGEECVVKWYEHVGDRGGWDIYIFPAYRNGEKAFLERLRWSPGENYSSGNDGKIEKILSFDEGFEIIKRKGRFDWMFQKD